MSSVEEEDTRSGHPKCSIVYGDDEAVSGYLMEALARVKRHRKREIQMLILTGSRERAFNLFSPICNRIQSTQLLCHVSVGSVKYERDLKALHFGVDILIITPGRLLRLYKGNENCFSTIRCIYLDQADVLFYRSMVKRVVLLLFSND